MYDRLLEDGFINPRFIDGVESFVEFSKGHPECMDGEKLRCPCNHRKCRNKNILDEFTVMTYLGNNSFVPNYYRWHHHGESFIPGPSVFDNHQEEASASDDGGVEQDDPGMLSVFKQAGRGFGKLKREKEKEKEKDGDEDEDEDKEKDGDEDNDEDKDEDEDDDDDHEEEEEECELHKKRSNFSCC
ncbi:hypothetical protein CQW23_07522 [Capsicum baccatum]|uniref:Transposase-associated domain-containing protein n=1 Tax=Capsicum baccatum TaxID=33114 RepID=A0A2G2X6H2_CAPBA|nr:hypothetical protein CQW23_07522 [Capsicum baccatum]